MNKKQQSSNKRRKRASIGLAVCFAAAIVLTGAYTWRNYRANVKDEQAKIEEEQQAKEEEIKRNTEETSSIAKKALEDEDLSVLLHRYLKDVQSYSTVLPVALRCKNFLRPALPPDECPLCV